jgi:hypothetical protein
MNDQLTEQLVEAIVKALVVIVPILFAILTRYIVKVLNKKAEQLDTAISETNNKLLKDAADLVVAAAEQMAPLNTGDKRMAYAKVQLQSLANGFGVELSERDAIALIEGTLGAINQELVWIQPQQDTIPQVEYSLEPESDVATNGS